MSSETVWLCRSLSPAADDGLVGLAPAENVLSEVYAASALLVTARGHNAEYTRHFS